MHNELWIPHIGYKSVKEGDETQFGTEIAACWKDQALMDSLVQTSYEEKIAEYKKHLEDEIKRHSLTNWTRTQPMGE